jgi:chemotaxis protein MotB
VKSVRLLTKPAYHEEEGEGSWAVSYGDMITLLLSFFVIYFTTDPAKEQVKKQNTFLALDLESNSAREGVSDKTDTGSKESMLPKFVVNEDANIKVTQQGEQLVVSFGATSFFSSGSTDISEKGIRLLRIFTERYMPYASIYRLSIKGFTDTKPVTVKANRRFRDNLELSALRSLSAMRELQRAGIPLKKMEIAGAGELKVMAQSLPAANGLTKEELNNLSRTIVLVISPDKESFP